MAPDHSSTGRANPRPTDTWSVVSSGPFSGIDTLAGAGEKGEMNRTFSILNVPSEVRGATCRDKVAGSEDSFLMNA